jgi:ribosomal protein S18 acetylase RimI-like enzyme
MPDIAIRRARPADAGRLSRLAMASKRDWGYSRQWLEAWAAQLTVTPDYVQSHAVYLLRTGNRLSGFYALVQGPRFWELDHFWIHPDAMGRGLGRRLLRHAVRHLRRHGARRLRIAADPNAVGFYQRMGANRIGSVAAPVGRVKRRLPWLELRIC